MPFGFPPSPTIGQQWPAVNPTWEWNGLMWEPIGGSGVPSTATPVTRRLSTLTNNVDFIGIDGTGPALVAASVIAAFAGSPPPPSAPAVMTVGQWTATPIAGGIAIDIDAEPAGSPTGYERSLDNGGTWAALADGAALGVRNITGLAATERQVRVRAVNAVGPAPDPGSDTKTVTPLAAGGGGGTGLNFVSASAVRAGQFGSDATLTFPSNVAAGNHVLAAFGTDSQSRNFSGTGATLDGTSDQSTSFRGQGLRIPSVVTPATVFPFTLTTGWNFGGGAIEVSGPAPVPDASFGGFDASGNGDERQLSVTVAEDNSMVLLLLAPVDTRTWTWGSGLTNIASGDYAPMAWVKLNAGTHILRFTPSAPVILNGYAAFVWSPGP